MQRYVDDLRMRGLKYDETAKKLETLEERLHVMTRMRDEFLDLYQCWCRSHNQDTDLEWEYEKQRLNDDRDHVAHQICEVYNAMSKILNNDEIHFKKTNPQFFGKRMSGVLYPYDFLE